MSGSVAHKKRLITVTAGNLRNHHLYISGHLDFFPEDCVAPADADNDHGRPVTIVLSGLEEEIETDIGRDTRTGKPRRFFRRRTY